MEDQGRLAERTENVCRVGKFIEGIGGCTNGVRDGGGREEGGARNRSFILLGSLRFLGKRGLEIRAGERTMEGLKGGTGGKEIARKIGVVDTGEESFGGKLSCK